MAVLIADGDLPLRGMDPEEFERQYQPSSRVTSLQPYIDDYAARGIAQRAALTHHRLTYGPHPDEWLWYAPADPAADPTGGEALPPLQVFIHGGYWQRLSGDDGTLSTADFVGRGAAFASINYTLCPAATLTELVRQVRTAVAWLVEHAATLGHDPNRIHLSGHSAGAHLVAMTVIDTPVHIAGVTFISGVFDLTAIVHTTVNDAVGLDDHTARLLSPLARVPRTDVPAVVAFGEHDTEEFRRQSLAWSSAWAEVIGNRPPVTLEVIDRNHFDIIHDLGDPTTPLGSAVLRQMALG